METVRGLCHSKPKKNVAVLKRQLMRSFLPYVGSRTHTEEEVAAKGERVHLYHK